MSVTKFPFPPDAEAAVPERRRWTVAEFERFIEAGVFGPEERLELINGELIQKMTQKEPHATAITLTGDTLRVKFGAGYHVRTQLPLVLGQEDRPEPDIAVVAGAPRDYAAQHPTDAVLVLEVADATLRYDRTLTAGMYARAGVAEFWIVNLLDRTLEVHRQPAPTTGQPLGHAYGSVTRFDETQSVAPLAAPTTPVSVADLLP